MHAWCSGECHCGRTVFAGLTQNSLQRERARGNEQIRHTVRLSYAFLDSLWTTMGLCGTKGSGFGYRDIISSDVSFILLQQYNPSYLNVISTDAECVLYKQPEYLTWRHSQSHYWTRAHSRVLSPHIMRCLLRLYGLYLKGFFFCHTDPSLISLHLIHAPG